MLNLHPSLMKRQLFITLKRSKGCKTNQFSCIWIKKYLCSSVCWNVISLETIESEGREAGWYTSRYPWTWSIARNLFSQLKIKKSHLSGDSGTKEGSGKGRQYSGSDGRAFLLIKHYFSLIRLHYFYIFYFRFSRNNKRRFVTGN